MRGVKDVKSPTHKQQIERWLAKRGGQTTGHTEGNRYAEIVEKMPRWRVALEALARNSWWRFEEVEELIRSSSEESCVGEVLDLLGPGDLSIIVFADDGMLILQPRHLKALREFLQWQGKHPLESFWGGIYHPWG